MKHNPTLTYDENKQASVLSTVQRTQKTENAKKGSRLPVRKKANKKVQKNLKTSNATSPFASKNQGRNYSGCKNKKTNTNKNKNNLPAQNQKLAERTKNTSNSQYLLIVDGSSLLATSYYSSLPKAIRKEKNEDKKSLLYEKLLKKDKENRYTNAVELFFHTLFTIMTFQHPSHLVICWDVTRNTFRKELWQSYKSNRSETPAPLREQFETAYSICEKLGIPQYRDSQYEADDFAGTLCTVMEEYMNVRILTRDKDYFQLISEKTRIWYGMSDLDKVRDWRRKHQMKTCLPSRVVEVDRKVLKREFGYLPESVPMIKALAGDASDNIPGVSGIGEIRSMKLAEHYLNPEELYLAIEKANTAQKKKKLNQLWKTWGINKSPYTCLTRRSNGRRKSAREMADLCYILGRIRTDIDLDVYNLSGFDPDLLLFKVSQKRLADVLSEYEIELLIGKRKKPALVLKDEANRAPRKVKPKKAQSTGVSKSRSSGVKSGSNPSNTQPQKLNKAKKSNQNKMQTSKVQTADEVQQAESEKTGKLNRRKTGILDQTSQTENQSKNKRNTLKANPNSKAKKDAAYNRTKADSSKPNPSDASNKRLSHQKNVKKQNCKFKNMHSEKGKNLKAEPPYPSKSNPNKKQTQKSNRSHPQNKRNSSAASLIPAPEAALVSLMA